MGAGDEKQHEDPNARQVPDPEAMGGDAPHPCADDLPSVEAEDKLRPLARQERLDVARHGQGVRAREGRRRSTDGARFRGGQAEDRSAATERSVYSREAAQRSMRSDSSPVA
jgi:hypothetical protein